MCSEKNAKRKEIPRECVSLEGSHVPCYNKNLKYFYFSWKEDEKTSSPTSQLLRLQLLSKGSWRRVYLESTTVAYWLENAFERSGLWWSIGIWARLWLKQNQVDSFWKQTLEMYWERMEDVLKPSLCCCLYHW